eukprot:SAG11_NODE_1011_length_6195_cov_4.901247_5_plen_325_part_00
MPRLQVLLLLWLGVVTPASTELAPGPWRDSSLPPAQRAEMLLAEMNQYEKLGFLHGGCKGYVFNSCGVPRLGVPNMMANDGPQGFRGVSGTSTAWPAGLAIAATFDIASSSAWGEGQGQEFFDKGANVQLGPGLCLLRAPLNGRAFEYMSGEDPYLGSTMVQPAVHGIQRKGVVANAKHFVDNNQENNREGVSANIDERTQWEMYYEPFRGAVEAGVGSIMCSLNKVNEEWACENEQVLTIDLKGRMNFSGWVMPPLGPTDVRNMAAGVPKLAAEHAGDERLGGDAQDQRPDGGARPRDARDNVHGIRCCRGRSRERHGDAGED